MKLIQSKFDIPNCLLNVTLYKLLSSSISFTVICWIIWRLLRKSSIKLLVTIWMFKVNLLCNSLLSDYIALIIYSFIVSIEHFIWRKNIFKDLSFLTYIQKVRQFWIYIYIYIYIYNQMVMNRYKYYIYYTYYVLNMSYMYYILY